jgi:hypothetical protein
MNMYTKEIAALLKTDIEFALKVQDQMEENGIDYSECSTAQFNRAAKTAAAELGWTAKKK